MCLICSAFQLILGRHLLTSHGCHPLQASLFADYFASLQSKKQPGSKCSPEAGLQLLPVSDNHAICMQLWNVDAANHSEGYRICCVAPGALVC